MSDERQSAQGLGGFCYAVQRAFRGAFAQGAVAMWARIACVGGSAHGPDPRTAGWRFRHFSQEFQWLNRHPPITSFPTSAVPMTARRRRHPDSAGRESATAAARRQIALSLGDACREEGAARRAPASGPVSVAAGMQRSRSACAQTHGTSGASFRSRFRRGRHAAVSIRLRSNARRVVTKARVVCHHGARSPRPRVWTAIWVGNETRFPRELAEYALAHLIGDKAEQAYADVSPRRRISKTFAALSGSQ